jgi:hypothetical protein
MNRVKYIAAAVAGVALVLSSAAHADSITDYIQLEAAIGGSAYQRAADGLWIQDGFEHHVDLTAPAVEGGITGDIYQYHSWGLSYHLDYAWLGTIKTQSKATTDANYNLKTQSCNGACLPLANFTGSGHDAGFLLTLEPHYDYGAWRFGVEGGPYVHRATWAVDATNQVNYVGQTPGSSHFVTNNAWALGYVVGASIEYKRFSLRYQYFRNGGRSSDPAPQIWTGTHVLTVGYRF